MKVLIRDDDYVAALAKRGYSDEDIESVLDGSLDAPDDLYFCVVCPPTCLVVQAAEREVLDMASRAEAAVVTGPFASREEAVDSVRAPW